MCRLTVIDCIELEQLVRALRHENARLRDVLSRAICGDLFDETTPCQLHRNHEGKHTWMSGDGELVMQWD